MSNGLQELEKTIRKQKASYAGKYRGFVADNEDPEARGRIKLRVPSVLGEASTDWALPCMPYGGAAGLGMLYVPPVGAQSSTITSYCLRAVVDSRIRGSSLTFTVKRSEATSTSRVHSEISRQS